MSYLRIIGISALSLWAFWGLYVLLMGVYRAHLAKRLSPFARALALPYLAIGIALDVAFNASVAALIFWERPREWFLTQRMIRYIAGADCWRRRIAVWICDGLLDPFDPTDNHC